MPPRILTSDSNWLRLNQDEIFAPFFSGYLNLLKSDLKQIQVMDHAGNPHQSYYTCEQDHDIRNQEWKPFQIIEGHCEVFGYDFSETLDIIQERVGRILKCECEILL
jgi:hypothetical protein